MSERGLLVGAFGCMLAEESVMFLKFAYEGTVALKEVFYLGCLG